MTSGKDHMIDTWFHWEDWDMVDTVAFNYFKCTLKKDFGDFKTGFVIPNIFVDFEMGIMNFYDAQGNDLANFELGLTWHQNKPNSERANS